MPFAYIQNQGNAFIAPLNSAISERFLHLYSTENRAAIFDAFVSLASAISPRVNPGTIRKRMPEARLAARLFDFDQIVSPMLGDLAQKFYETVQDDWQWNSRYWEQLALLHLERYSAAEPDGLMTHELRLALGHARHAVAIEDHPLTLTTLAKLLFTSVAANGSRGTELEDALKHLGRAIDREKTRDRISIHPFVVLFRGVSSLPSSIKLNESETTFIRSQIKFAKTRFKRDADVQASIDELERELSRSA